LLCFSLGVSLDVPNFVPTSILRCGENAVDRIGLRMDVALGDRYRTVSSDSGKHEHITSRFFSKIGQRTVQTNSPAAAGLCSGERAFFLERVAARYGLVYY
jgi:hypothetical protein